MGLKQCGGQSEIQGVPALMAPSAVVFWRLHCMYVYLCTRASSLTTRYAGSKPHPRLKAFGTSAGFSTTRGWTQDLQSILVHTPQPLASTYLNPWSSEKPAQALWLEPQTSG